MTEREQAIRKVLAVLETMHRWGEIDIDGSEGCLECESIRQPCPTVAAVRALLTDDI